MRREYPDPAAVAYPTTLPPPFPCQMTTRNTAVRYPVHEHGAYMNGQGDGNTDVVSGHYHRIKDGRVLPDESDGHIHEITMLPCGAGAARSITRNGEMIRLGDPTAVTASVDPYLAMSPAELARRLRVREDDYAKMKKSFVRLGIAMAAVSVLAVGLGAVLVMRSGD